MEMNPIQLIGAFIAACFVLAAVRIKDCLTWRYSLRSLLIAITGAAIVLAVISVVLRVN